MRRRRRPAAPIEFQEFVDKYEPINQLADALGWPRDWIVCPHCSAHSWRLPPHMFNSCPLIEEMVSSAGLKMDAERVQAIRGGLAMEANVAAFRKLIEDHLGGDEDEDEDDE